MIFRLVGTNMQTGHPWNLVDNDLTIYKEIMDEEICLHQTQKGVGVTSNFEW